MSGVQNMKQQNTKHSSRACLECRSRHLKCDGRTICGRCEKNNRICTYVKSNRGGSRKKGVTLKRKIQSAIEDDVEDNIENDENDDDIDNKNVSDGYDEKLKNENRNEFEFSSNGNIKSKRIPNTTNNYKSDHLPCVENGLGHLADNPDCTKDCLNMENPDTTPPCMKKIDKASSKRSNNKNDFHPIFNGSKNNNPLEMIFDDSKLVTPLDQCYISPALIKDLNVNSIISSFYNSFYSAHPFLPPKEHILNYLEAIPYNYDILLAMKIMADGQTSSKYARDIETINFLVISLITYIRQIGKDFISLQSLLLLAMISHISSLHDLSPIIREAAISLALELKMNLVDRDNVSDVFLDVNGFLTERDEPISNIHVLNTPPESDSKLDLDLLFNSPRVSSIPYDILIDTVRKTFWELYYFDSISGTASGHTKSRLATQRCLVLYPTLIPLSVFDYKSRAEACKLVNDSISLNIAIQSNADCLPHLNHMRAALGNWEMKLSNPETYGMPYLINKYGTVNEGVFEAIMLLNYARIFTHRPFSYLWRPDISKHPRCTDEEGIDDPCTPLDNKESQSTTDSRKIIETRKTIDSANFLMKTLLDTDPGQTCKRTPFLACALAFSCLVHLSAYAWVDSNLSMLDSLDENDRKISSSELDIYTEYIKLEIGSTLQISRHWSLSAKLVTHISEMLSKVSSKLYKKVQAGSLGLGMNLSNAPSQKLSNDPIRSTLEESSSSIFESPMDKSSTCTTVYSDTNKTPIIERQSSYVPNNTQSSTPIGPQLNSFNNQRFSHSQTSLSQQNLQFVRVLQSNPHTEQPLSANATYNANNSTNSSNTFMSEFNDLVNCMHAANSGDANFAGSVDAQDYEFLDPLSPSSNTGCDWVDKHAFNFDAF